MIASAALGGGALAWLAGMIVLVWAFVMAAGWSYGQVQRRRQWQGARPTAVVPGDMVIARWDMIGPDESATVRVLVVPARPFDWAESCDGARS